MTAIVVRCLAYGHARPATDVLERLRRARVTVDEESVELALLEAREAGQVVEVGRGLWQRA